MPAGLPEPRGFGSPFLPTQVFAVNDPFNRSRGFAVCALFTLLVLAVAPRALADDAASDRHEVPTFVLERVDVLTDAVRSSCQPPCDRPNATARCARQAPSSPAPLQAGSRSERLAMILCGAD